MPLDAAPVPHLPAGPPQAMAQRLQRLAAAAQEGQAGARAELRQACQMLEAHFVSWLLREMRQTVPQGGLLPHGPAQETCDHLLDDALAQAVARAGGIGIARTLERQLARRAAPPHQHADPAHRPERAETPDAARREAHE
ncbi:MAG: rod-binding protein [Candidatus Brocadiia bacterium]